MDLPRCLVERVQMMSVHSDVDRVTLCINWNFIQSFKERVNLSRFVEAIQSGAHCEVDALMVEYATKLVLENRGYSR